MTNKRKNKGWFNDPIRHKLAAYGIRTSACGKSESEMILREELKRELENINPDDIEITEEEKKKFEEEAKHWKAIHEGFKNLRRKAENPKEYAELLADELRIIFDESKENVYVESNDYGTYDIVGIDLPYHWAVEITGVNSYYGIKGYQEDDFFLEPRTGNVLTVSEK